MGARVDSTDYLRHTCPEADRLFDLQMDDLHRAADCAADCVDVLIAVRAVAEAARECMQKIHDKNKELRDNLRNAMDEMADEIAGQTDKCTDLESKLEDATDGQARYRREFEAAEKEIDNLMLEVELTKNDLAAAQAEAEALRLENQRMAAQF